MKMDTESLVEELVRVPREMNMGAHPFLTALAGGTCPRQAIRRYAVETYVLASAFPQRLASLMAMCPHSRVRLELVRNLLEEEGITSFDGERIVQRQDRHHGQIARRFAHAAGVDDEELARAQHEERRPIWVDQAIAEKRLCTALAYLTVGFEGCVPPTYTLLVSALEGNYGFSRDDLEFFILHMTADVDHARFGAEMIATLVSGEADREEAVTGVKRATTAWWWWHRSFVR